MNYYFEDFTFENYRKLLHLAKTQGPFKFYHNYQNEARFILWRHDIDISVHAALKLARIESEMGIQSTYFVLLHSSYYHFMEFDIRNKLREIIELGHEIGLHFDAHFYQIQSLESLEKYLSFEKEIIERYLDCEVHCFSFHDPDPYCLSMQATEYAGMQNTYAAHFQQEVAYCSDSNGYWRHQRLEDVLRAAPPKLQILTHPAWWVAEVKAPRQRILDCVQGRALRLMQVYDQRLAQMQRGNIDE